MSDRPVEDEIMDEARRFGHSMAQMMRMHAQANGWWEQRKVRRQISLEMRRQRRAEQAERAHQKVWTAQMIHRYQIAAQARADRALDPRISAEQRRRDAEVDARHLDELRERIVGNARLTQVERGIALDCLETARMWPHAKVKTPELLERAPKVRGVNALRYRARLARETAWVQQRRQERAQQYQQSVREQQYQQLADGGVEHVTARTTEWSRSEPGRQDSGETALEELTNRYRLSIEHNVELSDQNARLTRELTALRADREQVAEIEARIRKLADAQEERDRKIAVLQRSVDAVTAGRDELRSKLDAAEARIETLQNLNRGLSVERNTLRGERDQAIRKLADRTRAPNRSNAQQRDGRPSNEPGTEQKRTQSWWQEAEKRAHDAMQAAADDRSSEVVNAKIREFSADPDSAAKMGSRFADWWVKEGGQQQYEAEQRTRGNTSAGRPGAGLSPEQQAQQRDFESMRAAFYDPESAVVDSTLREIVPHIESEKDLSDRFAVWWAEKGGREQYRAEQHTHGGENTAVMPREHLPTPPETNGHRRGRNGIERSR
jgi:hypothetical protein